MKKRTYMIISNSILILVGIAEYITGNQPLSKREEVAFQKIAWNSLDPYEKYKISGDWKKGKVYFEKANSYQYFWDEKSYKYKFYKVVLVKYKVENDIAGDFKLLIDRQTKEIVAHGIRE